MAHLEKAYIHPVKGCRGQRLTQSFYLDTSSQLMGDRQFAFRIKNIEKNAEWASKRDFLCGETYPKMLPWKPHFNTSKQQLSLHDGVSDSVLKFSDLQAMPNDDVNYFRRESGTVNKFARMVGHEDDVALVGASWRHGRPLTDQQTSYISIGNIATLRALANEWNITDHHTYGLHPARFGINLWLDGLEPFSEFDWVERQEHIKINTLVLRARKHIIRCGKVNASPYTGERNLAVYNKLRQKAKELNWKVPGESKILPLMGVFAEVTTAGEATAGMSAYTYP